MHIVKLRIKRRFAAEDVHFLIKTNKEKGEKKLLCYLYLFKRCSFSLIVKLERVLEFFISIGILFHNFVPK